MRDQKRQRLSILRLVRQKLERLETGANSGVRLRVRGVVAGARRAKQRPNRVRGFDAEQRVARRRFQLAGGEVEQRARAELQCFRRERAHRGVLRGPHYLDRYPVRRQQSTRSLVSEQID